MSEFECVRERERENLPAAVAEQSEAPGQATRLLEVHSHIHTYSHARTAQLSEKKLQGTYDREERARREDICVFEKREKWKPPPCLISKTADTYLELAHDQGKKMSSVRSIHCLVDAMH